MCDVLVCLGDIVHMYEVKAIKFKVFALVQTG